MFRTLALALLLIAAAGCKPKGDLSPFTDSRAPPELAGRFLPPEGWAWGLVQTGSEPAQRYGVSAPRGMSQGEILILPGYGESAEGWFETARDLNARGFTVWILDRTGQGGSGRHVAPRDLGHAASFEPDVVAVASLLRQVIRPTAGRAVTILAHAEAAPVALMAVEQGAPATRLILSAPTFGDSTAAAAGNRPSSASPPTGWTPWRRDAAVVPKGFQGDPRRGAIQHAWQLANPDLRMSEPSRGWRAAFDQASASARRDLSDARPPTLMFPAPMERAWNPCPAMPDCRASNLIVAGATPHLQTDSIRNAWLSEVTGFAATDHEL